MESKKRPNEDDAPGPTAATLSAAESHSSSQTSNSTQSDTTKQGQADSKMDVDAPTSSSAAEAAPSPTVVAAATLAAKEFSNKRVRLTKEAEKAGSDYSPSSDIPDPATQSTESKGMQEWMESLDEDKENETTADAAKNATTSSATDKAPESTEADSNDKDQSVGSKADQSGTGSSQALGQLKVNPELLREQPSTGSVDSTGKSGADSSSGANDLVRALLTPTESKAPSADVTLNDAGASAPSTAADQRESKSSEDISSSILAVASLSEPMLDVATALETNQDNDKSVTVETQPSDNNSGNDTNTDLIQLLTNPTSSKSDAAASSVEDKTVTTEADSSITAPTNDVSAPDGSSAENSAGQTKASEDSNKSDDLKNESMQMDMSAITGLTSKDTTHAKDAQPSSDLSITEGTIAKSSITRYEGDDVIMTIATGPTSQATASEPVPINASEQASQPSSLEGTSKADTTDSQKPNTQQQTPAVPLPESVAAPRPASQLPPISHNHSLSHSVPRMAASDPNLHERKLSLPETLPPISSLSGAQPLPSLNSQAFRSSMSLSAMLINNDDDKPQEPAVQPPRMPRNIFDQPQNTSRGASPPSPLHHPPVPPPQHKVDPSQPDVVVPKAEPPMHRTMPRYSPPGSETTTPQQPVDEQRGGGGPGNMGNIDHTADEVMESGGVGGYAGHRYRPGSASDGRPSPTPASGHMDGGHAKLPSLSAISQPHGASPLHASPVGPGQHGPPPSGRFMPGYSTSHQGSPHASAPLPPPQQHAGHPSLPPPPHHGHATPPSHHHPQGAPPPSHHGPPASHQTAPNGHGHLHYPGPPQPMMAPTSSHHSPHYGHPHSQRPRLIVKNSENLHLPDRPELFLGYYRYEPGALLPSMEGKENSLLEVRIASSYLTYDNTKVRKRNLWGTDIYTDDSDIVAMIIHMGLFIPPLSSQVTEQELLHPQTLHHNFVEVQSSMRHLCPPFDLTVTLRVLPKLVKYQGSIRNRIKSRSWMTNHDGVSLKIESVRKLPLGTALNKGRSQSKKRVQENNAERLRVLADNAYDDTTESLQNEKALRAAMFEFTHQGDPCFKYTPELVMDRHDGLSRKWTSWRLKKEVLILENDEERYEISLQHHAGTDSRRFDRYRVAVISPRTSLSSWSKATYPLDKSQLVEILYEDLDWQDFEWVERGVVIQPDRHGTSASSSSQQLQQNGTTSALDSAMEGVESADRANDRSTTGAATSNGVAVNDDDDGEHHGEEGVFCLVSRLYWRPMSENRSEMSALPLSSQSSRPVAEKEAIEELHHSAPPGAAGGDDQAEAPPNRSSLPAPQMESVEKNNAMDVTSTTETSTIPTSVVATAAIAPPRNMADKEEGELEEGEVVE